MNRISSSDVFEKQLIKTLNDHANQLDADITTRLRCARSAAINSSRQGTNKSWSSWPGIAGLVAVALLLSVSLHNQPASSVETPLLDDLDLLVTEDLEFYRQLEVLEWMDSDTMESDV